MAFTAIQKPKIFLIGDSISVQYWPYLKEYLSDIADIERKKDDGQAEKNLDVPVGANGGDSRMVLEYLRAKYADEAFRPDYLLLNCGLHDIKHDPKTGVIQVTEDDYRKNLNEIVDLLQKNRTELIWIRTTWVVDSIHNAQSSSIRRYGDDVIRYNAIADDVMVKHQVKSIDLYQFSKQQGIEHIADHVHYDLPTRALQAAYIAGFVENELKK
jgi:lysophospholipase L1-like esterase